MKSIGNNGYEFEDDFPKLKGLVSRSVKQPRSFFLPPIVFLEKNPDIAPISQAAKTILLNQGQPVPLSPQEWEELKKFLK